MLERLKENWNEFRSARPGARFRDRYERKQRERQCDPVRKALYIIAGVAVVLVGLFLLPLPGPGIVVVILGAALVAQESYLVAAALDRAECRLHKIFTRTSRAPR